MQYKNYKSYKQASLTHKCLDGITFHPHKCDFNTQCNTITTVHKSGDYQAWHLSSLGAGPYVPMSTRILGAGPYLPMSTRILGAGPYLPMSTTILGAGPYLSMSTTIS